jgi:sigma-B regulation protein RsbU (phosphoserine phosphatase)
MSAVPAARTSSDASGARDARTVALLAGLSEALAVSLDLDHTLSEAVHRIAHCLDAEAASLFLFDAARERIECRICVGPVEITGLSLAPGQGIVGRCVAENRSEIVTDAASDPRVWRAGDDRTGFVTRSLICVPLATAAGPIGALELINRRDGSAFENADVELLRLLAAPTALAINNARLAEDLVAQQRLRREFELARRMQESLLPTPRAHFPVSGLNLPAHEISGDFYDWFEAGDGRVGFVIGDVSGKGMDAALLMVRAASLLRWIGKDGTAPAEWLARANDELCATARDGRFVCALVGSCDRQARTVRFAAAGFPPALVRTGGKFEAFPAGGPPLGILAGVGYDEHEVALRGGAFYAYSDGATDVRRAGGDRLGDTGMQALIADAAAMPAGERLRGLMDALRAMRLVDDTTLLLVEAPVAPAHSPMPAGGRSRRSPDGILLERRLAADPQALCGLREALRAALDAAGVGTAQRDRLVLAIDEACTNIIRHAYAGCGGGEIRLRLAREGTELAFTLEDDAPAVDPARVRPKELGVCRAGGLGVAFIDEVMDAWRIEPSADGRGNRLVLRKRIDEEEGT